MPQHLLSLWYTLAVGFQNFRRNPKRFLLFLLGFFTASLILLAVFVSFDAMSTPSSIAYSAPENTLLLYFDDRAQLERLNTYRSPDVLRRAYATLRTVQVFTNTGSAVSRVALLRPDFQALTLAAPKPGIAAMTTYEMQRLNVKNGDVLWVDGEAFTVLFNPSLRLEDAGITIVSDSDRGNGRYVFAFALNPAASVEAVLRDIETHIGQAVRPFSLYDVRDGIAYSTASGREALTRGDTQASLSLLLLLDLAIYLYIIFQMLYIARYHFYKDSKRYALARLFAGKRRASLLFVIALMPAALVGLLLATLAMAFYFSHPIAGATVLPAFPARAVAYTVPIVAAGVFLLERAALWRTRGYGIADALRGHID